MKKCLVAILAFVYLAATVGITLQQHYCMDKLVGWSFFEEKGDMCSTCGMSKNDPGNSCCKDQHIKVKIGDDQQASIIVVHFHQPDPLQAPAFFIDQPGLKLSPTEKYVADHGPPYTRAVPVFLLNRVFRI